MELTTKQRIVLLTLVQGIKQGHILEMRLRRELAQKLEFTEEESKSVKMVQLENGDVAWDSEHDQGWNIELGETERHMILRELHTLERNGQIEDIHLEVIDLFPWTER